MAINIKGTKAGTTTITAYYTDGGVTVSSPVSFTVTQATGYLTATTTNRTYNGSSQTIATIASHSGDYYFGIGSSSSSAPSSWGSKNTDLQATNAGTYYVWVKCDANTGYYNAVSAKYIGTVTIAQREVSVTAPTINSTALTYNKQEQNLTTGGSCGTGGTMYYYASTSSTTPTFSTSTWTTSAAKATAAGTYNIWYYCYVSDTDNNKSASSGTAINTVTKLSGTKQIVQKTASLSWGTTSWTYDGSTHSTTCTVSNLESGDSCTVTLTGNSVGKNVGSATVTASSLNNANYKLPSANTKSISITAKTATLSWGTITWTYDGNAHSTTCTVSNLVSGDTCTVTLSGNSITDVGTKKVTATGLSNTNYALPTSGLSKTLTVNARSVSITAPSINNTALTYNKQAQNLTTGGSCGTGGTMYYYASTSSTAPTVSGEPGTGWTTSAAQATNAGTYNIWYYCYVPDTANNTGTGINTVTKLTNTKAINQKEVTLTWGTTSWTYDGSTHSTTCTAGSLCTGDSCTVNLSNNSVGKNVGSQTVTASSLTNANYKLPSATTKSISITAKAVELEWGTLSWTYDGNAHSTTCNVKSSSLISGDTCTVTLTGNSITNVGTTTVTASSLSNSNYKLPSSGTSKTLTISQRTVTITAPTYNSSTLTYNKQAQTITAGGSCTPGGTMYYYISTTNSTPTFSTASGSGWSTSTPVQATNAGTYYVWYYCQVTDTDNNTGTGINTVTKISSATSKVINKKTVTLTWGKLTWMYDGAAHSTTCTAGSLCTGDSCTVNLTDNSITNVGTKTVTASSLSNSNYQLPSSKTNTLEITARTVTYTADNQSKTYDGSVLTANNNATRSGNTLVSGHTATITCSGEIGPAVGSGAKTLDSVVIMSGSTNVSSNYDITKVNGTLTISQAAISIPTPTGVTVTYDAASHTATFGAASGASITNYRWSTTNGSNWTTSTTNPGKVNAETYYVQAYYTADSNHSGSGWSSSATVKINKRAVTITGGTATKAYDGTALTYTSATEPTLTGAVSGHHIHSYSAAGTITYVGNTAVTISNATIYSGTHNGTEVNQTNNYTITYAPGTLTITKADPTISISGITADYTGGQFYATVTGTKAKGTLYWKKGSTASASDTAVPIGSTGTPLTTPINITSVKDNSDDFVLYWYFVPSSSENISSGHTYAENYNTAGGTSNDKVNLTINPRSIANVTASAAAVTYSGSSQTASVTVSDSGATLTSNDYTISGNSKTDAGTYTITLTGKNNYTGTKSVSWTINKRAVTVTAGSDSKVYDGTALTKNSATASAQVDSGNTHTGMISTHHLHSYTVTGTQTAVGSSDNVPSAAKIYSGNHSGTETDVTSNYTITYANGTLTVSARTVTPTAPTFTTGTLTYNGSAQTILNAGSCTTGGTMYYYISTSSTKPTWSTASGSGWSTTAPTTRTNAGTYYVWWYCYVSDTTNNTGTGINTVTAVSGNSRTIGQRTVTITAPTRTNRTYNGSAQTIFTAGSATTGGVIYYSESNTTFDASTWSTTIPYTKKTTAGTYTIYWYCYVSDTANNKGTGINTKNTLTATISKAAGSITYTNTESITIYCTETAGAATKTDVAKTLEVASASASNATGTVSYAISQSGWSIASDGKTITIPANTNTGTYDFTITATAAESTNYNQASVTNNVTVVINDVVLTSIVLTLGATTIAYDASTSVTSVRANYNNGTYKPDVQAELTPNASSGSRIVSSTSGIVQIKKTS